MMRPPIGRPRVYDSALLPMLYPGEVARPNVDQAAFEAMLERASPSGDLVVDVPITGWIVEPMAGWEGRWLRWRYRVWGRWFRTGAPKLNARIRYR